MFFFASATQNILLLQVRLTEFLTIWGTFVAMVALNLEYGMLVGIGISLVLFTLQVGIYSDGGFPVLVEFIVWVDLLVCWRLECGAGGPSK